MGRLRILIAIALVAGVGSVQAKDVPKAPEKPSESITQPPRVLTAEDYWVPLDNWLKKQGSPLSGRDFYEVGLAYKLDPDFLIAVAKAETQLGTVKQRGSTYNIGSVCSHDSTNTTCQATSYRQGIEMIAQTVNNNLLGRYTHVSQFSRAGNCCGPIYASSPSNWHRNVTTTMNALKGTNHQDFNIRR